MTTPDPIPQWNPAATARHRSPLASIGLAVLYAGAGLAVCAVILLGLAIALFMAVFNSAATLH